MNAPVLVRSLFDLPDRIYDGDFVLKLTESLEHPDVGAQNETARGEREPMSKRARGRRQEPHG